MGPARVVDPSPEACLILLSTREAAVVGCSALRSAAAGVRDWDALAQLAIRHGVAGFVLNAAQRAGVAFPKGASAPLHDGQFAAIARAMLLDDALERISTGLHAAGVPVIVLKGPALARTIYAEPRLRAYDDLDLTVRDDHEAAAAAVLESYDLREIPFNADRARPAHADHMHGEAVFHRVFVSADGRVKVELHLDPLQLGLRPTAEAARWHRAIPVPGLPGASMLCFEDQLVQLSVHAHKHGFSRLIWLKDLDLLLRAAADRRDWGLVGSVAAQEGVRASVWYSLGLARLLLAAPVSRETLAALQPAAPVRALYRLMWPPGAIADLGGFMRRRAVQFHAAESWRGMLPSLVLLGRRRDRVRALFEALARR